MGLLHPPFHVLASAIYFVWGKSIIMPAIDKLTGESMTSAIT